MLQGSPEDKIAAAESILRATPLSELQEAGPYTTPQRDTFGAGTDVGAITGGNLGDITTDMETIRGFPLSIPQPENPIEGTGGAVIESFSRGQGMGFEYLPPEGFEGGVYRSPNLPAPTRYAPTPQEEAVGMTSFRPEGSTLEEMGEMFDFYQDGGHVQQKYAYGGQVPHGTVAGELGRRGDMSVREEGETMAELSKRHRERDWYSKDKMGGGLGSLGPLRRDRRRA